VVGSVSRLGWHPRSLSERHWWGPLGGHSGNASEILDISATILLTEVGFDWSCVYVTSTPGWNAAPIGRIGGGREYGVEV